MSITAECNVCGKKYQAPANLAGKKVRCKQCGNIFVIGGGSEEAPDLDALANLEKSHHSLDATATGHVAGNQSDDEEGGSPTPLRTARTNVRFSFPLARELDQWAPLILIGGGILWLAAFLFRYDSTVPKWVPSAWLALALLMYLAIVHPLTLAMVRSAGRQFGYSMPLNDQRRALAAFLPPFVLAYVMWGIGDGQIVPLILGCVAATGVAAATVWLLFRLRPAEIAPTTGYSAIGFVIGMSIAAAILFGLNVLLINVAISVKKPDLVPASPFGPGLSWISPEDRDRMLAEIAKNAHPAPRISTVSDGTSANSIPAPGPISSSIFKSSQIAPVASQFDDILRPLADSRYLGIVHKTGETSVTIDVWDADSWKQAGSNAFTTSSEAGKRRALSPDGLRLARIVSFPSLCIQVWNYSQGSVKSVYFSQQPGTPELLGFTGNMSLVVMWQKDVQHSALESIDVTTGQRIALIDQIPAFDPSGSTIAVSHDGALAAIAARFNNVPTILVYNLQNGKQQAKTPIASLDSRWPVAPTGLAFSPDRKQLAVLFEQGGSGLLQSYDVESMNSAQPHVFEQVYPAGPILGGSPRNYSGSSIAWLPDSNGWILYGRALFSSNGQKVADIGINNVQSCVVRSPDTVELLSSTGNSSTQKQINVLHLDLPKVASMVK